MKKGVLTIFAIIFVWAGFAQTGIFVDKTNEDGSRFIASESVNCRSGFSDRHPMFFAVTRFSFGDRVAWALSVDFTDVVSFKIPEGARMLIKLSDDSVIELKQTLPAEQTEDIVGRYNNAAKVRIHTMHGSYEVSEGQLSEIAKKGVTKIRVERAADSFDVNYKKEKVGAAVAAAYEAVKNAAAGNSDLRSGF